MGGFSGPTTSIGSKSLTSSAIAQISARQERVAEKVKALEVDVKKRLSSNFTSVKKAFLELDSKHLGYITAEDFARFMGAQS